MAYSINFTNLSKTAINVADGQKRDDVLSIPLWGRGYSNYGELVIQAIVHNMEHFSNSIAPPNPTPGQFWHENTTNNLWMWNEGGGWVDVRQPVAGRIFNVHISDDAKIDIYKLRPTLPGRMIVGNSDSEAVPTWVDITGDVLIDPTGNTQLQADVVNTYEFGGVIDQDQSFGVVTSPTDRNFNILAHDSYVASLNIHGASQGSGRLYIGQSPTAGGGIMYNGDNTPVLPGTSDYTSFYRRSGGTDFEVFRYSTSSDQVDFHGEITSPRLRTGLGEFTFLENNYLQLQGSGDPRIELRSNDGGIPYIDWSNSLAGNYDARLQLGSDNQLTLLGSDLLIGGTGQTQNTTLTVNAADSVIAKIQAFGNSEGTAMLYLGQSASDGGGVIYNGDNNPSIVGTINNTAFYRRTAGTDTEVFRYSSTSSHVRFNSNITLQGSLYVNDTNTRVTEGSNNAVRLQTNFGYIDVGPQSTSFADLRTDRASFRFDKHVISTGDFTTLSGNLYINNTNTHLTEGTADSLRVITPTGRVDIGSQHADWAYITTDRSKFFVDKEIHAVNRFQVYNTDTYLNESTLNLMSTGSPNIELRSTDGGNPSIDFSNSGTGDYDVRISLASDNSLLISDSDLTISHVADASARNVVLNSASSAYFNAYGAGAADAGLFVGQSASDGAVMQYKATADQAQFLRRVGGVDSVTAYYSNTSNNWFFTGDTTILGGQLFITDGNTQLTNGAGQSIRHQTSFGFIDVGAQDTTWGTLATDRSKFFLNKEAHVTDRLQIFNTATYLTENLLNISATGSPAIELRSTNGGTPRIDFSNDGVADYDMRLQLNANDELDVIGGGIDIQAGNLQIGRDSITTARSVIVNSKTSAFYNAYGDGSANAGFYLGKDLQFGGFMHYQAATDRVQFLRRTSGTDSVTAYYQHNSDDWNFNGSLVVGSNITLASSLFIGDTNTQISKGTNNSVRISTNSGWVDVGAQDTSFTHFSTDRALFSFDKGLDITGNVEVTNNDITGIRTLVGTFGNIASSTDEFLRLNHNNTHTSGTYISHDLRVDGTTRFGSGGGEVIISPNGNTTINGVLSMGSGGTIDLNSNTITDVGKIEMNGVVDMATNDIQAVKTIRGTYGIMMESRDEYLRINDGGQHTNGIYTGGSVIRTDAGLQVGASGARFNVDAVGNTTIDGTLSMAGGNISLVSEINGVYGQIASSSSTEFLLLNAGGGHTNGTHAIGDFRADELQVGINGSQFRVESTGNTTITGTLSVDDRISMTAGSGADSVIDYYGAYLTASGWPYLKLDSGANRYGYLEFLENGTRRSLVSASATTNQLNVLDSTLYVEDGISTQTSLEVNARSNATVRITCQQTNVNSSNDAIIEAVGAGYGGGLGIIRSANPPFTNAYGDMWHDGQFFRLKNYETSNRIQIDSNLTVNGSVEVNGNLAMQNNRIASLASPTFGTDATNKDYVDNLRHYIPVDTAPWTEVPGATQPGGSHLELSLGQGLGINSRYKIVGRIVIGALSTSLDWLSWGVGAYHGYSGGLGTNILGNFRRNRELADGSEAANENAIMQASGGWEIEFEIDLFRTANGQPSIRGVYTQRRNGTAVNLGAFSSTLALSLAPTTFSLGAYRPYVNSVGNSISGATTIYRLPSIAVS